MDSPQTRKHCFTEEDDGLASLAEKDSGISGNYNQTPQKNFFCRPLHYSVRSLSSAGGSPRSRRFGDGRYEEHRPHFLDACFLCKKPLGDNKDIFMYRGDTPFCSEECRQEQIEIDEAKERNWNLSASMAALRKDQKKSKSTSPSKAQDEYPFRKGTVAVA
ncbi:hypothetical protein NMG60_11030183 [Bertholletia excelsa]